MSESGGSWIEDVGGLGKAANAMAEVSKEFLKSEPGTKLGNQFVDFIFAGFGPWIEVNLKRGKT